MPTTPDEPLEPSSRDTFLALLRRVEYGIWTADMDAARVAWYELGLALSHDAYLVLRPWDVVMPNDVDSLLRLLTEHLASCYQKGTASGLPFEVVQAFARALSRRQLDLEAAQARIAE